MEPRQSYFNAGMMNRIVRKCKALKDRQDLIEFMESWTAKTTISTEQEKVCEMTLNIAYKTLNMFSEDVIISTIENARFALTMEE